MAAHAPSSFSSSAAAALSFEPLSLFLFSPCPSLPPPLAQQSALRWPRLLQLLHCFLGLGASTAKASSFEFDLFFLISRQVNSSRIIDSNILAVRGLAPRHVL